MNDLKLRSTAIPLISMDMTKDCKVEITPDKLVDIQKYSNGEILCESEYYRQGIKGSINKCIAREKVVNKLLDISHKLPNGYKLKVFDAWRPYNVQYSLYYNYMSSLIDTHKYEEVKVKELREITSEFVSLPVIGKLVSYVHSSGGAVDLTIVNKDGIELNMGSSFDEFSTKSNTRYYEDNAENLQARDNRRLLYNIMTDNGFTNLSSEWWHYDYGDKFWACTKDMPVMYNSIYDMPENLKKEVVIHG